MLDFNEHRRSSDTSEAKEALLEIVRMEGDEGESEVDKWMGEWDGRDAWRVSWGFVKGGVGGYDCDVWTVQGIHDTEGIDGHDEKLVHELKQVKQ